MLDIAVLADRAPYQLSGGQKKRVAIASVLVMNPEVLLFDEPTAALDPRTQQWLIELIVELNAAGKTIVLATHDLDTLDRLADRCVVFSEDHRVAAEGPTARILGDEELLVAVNLVHDTRTRTTAWCTHIGTAAIIMITVEELLDRLREQGGRITTARRLVVSTLLGATGHVTAEELAAAIQAQHPEVHLSTVYRTLDSLEKLGIVEHTHVGHGPAVYHVGVTHQHLVCEECGAVIDVPTDLLEELRDTLARAVRIRLARRALRVARSVCIASADARRSHLSESHIQRTAR